MIIGFLNAPSNVRGKMNRPALNLYFSNTEMNTLFRYRLHQLIIIHVKANVERLIRSSKSCILHRCCCCCRDRRRRRSRRSFCFRCGNRFLPGGAWEDRRWCRSMREEAGCCWSCVCRAGWLARVQTQGLRATWKQIMTTSDTPLLSLLI